MTVIGELSVPRQNSVALDGTACSATLARAVGCVIDASHPFFQSSAPTLMLQPLYDLFGCSSDVAREFFANPTALDNYLALLAMLERCDEAIQVPPGQPHLEFEDELWVGCVNVGSNTFCNLLARLKDLAIFDDPELLRALTLRCVDALHVWFGNRLSSFHRSNLTVFTLFLLKIKVHCQPAARPA